MTYVYDLILNFHPKLYDFYEWNKEDKLYHIKRINLVKIASDAYNEILENKIVLNDELLLSIFNRCEYFENRSINTIPYAILITDSYRVMALKFDLSGNIQEYSSLLLDEEEDVLDISERLGTIKLNYQIQKKCPTENNLTRYEDNILKYIKKDLDISYQNKDINKLKYLYYEYFNKPSDNIQEIYCSLIKELKEMNNKHLNLYNLIKLSYTHKNV